MSNINFNAPLGPADLAGNKSSSGMHKRSTLLTGTALNMSNVYSNCDRALGVPKKRISHPPADSR